METVDILLIAGALMLVLFVGLLYVVLKATARTAENAREIMLALEDITSKVRAIEELDGAAETMNLSRSELLGSGSAPATNGSGDGTEVPS